MGKSKDNTRREGENNAIPLGPATWPTWLGIGLLTLVWALPAVIRNALAGLLGKIQSRRDSRHRRTALVNIEACRPELNQSERQAFLERYMSALMQTVFLTPRLWWASRKHIQRKTRFHGRQHIDAAVNNNRALVVLVSHTVCLDAGLIALSPDYPMRGVYNPFPNPVIDWLVLRARCRFGGQPYARGSGFRPIIKGLQEGCLFFYLSDEDLGAKGSVFAPFFGHKKATLAMLPRIVRKTNAVVVPMVTHYDARSDCFDVHFLDPLEHYPTEDDVENARALNAAIERGIEILPEQYFWKLRLFRTCPDGGTSRYARIERGELTPDEL